MKSLEGFLPMFYHPSVDTLLFDQAFRRSWEERVLGSFTEWRLVRCFKEEGKEKYSQKVMALKGTENRHKSDNGASCKESARES